MLNVKKEPGTQCEQPPAVTQSQSGGNQKPAEPLPLIAAVSSIKQEKQDESGAANPSQGVKAQQNPGSQIPRGVSPPSMGPTLKLMSPTSLGVGVTSMVSPQMSPGMSQMSPGMSQISPGMPQLSPGLPPHRPGMMGMPGMTGSQQQIPMGFRGPEGPMFRPRHVAPGMRMMRGGPPGAQRANGPRHLAGGPLLRDPRTGQQLRFRPPRGWNSPGERPRGSGPPRLSFPGSGPPPLGPRLVRAAVPTRFVQTASGLLVPEQVPNPNLGIETSLHSKAYNKSPKSPTKVPNKSTGQSVTLRKIYLCPTCGLRFPMPESDPESNFKTNFSCHVLFNHLRSEVESEMGADDLEVCPADECPYNIVQLKEDGVPDAESFLLKHYISKHLEVLLPLINDNPTYCHEACIKTISINKPEGEKPPPPNAKTHGMPNNKLKPIFLDKYFKFARTVAKCSIPADCDPMHIVVFLSQWTSRRNYSIAGVKTLVHWISEVHSLEDGKPLFFHPKIVEFVKLMENRLSRGTTAADGEPIIDTTKESASYGEVITNPLDIIKSTVCTFCNDKFEHTIKLLYHMLHLHKVNPVHFVNKNLRAKPVRCNHCLKPCMSPITYALHADQHNLKKTIDCSNCKKKYSSHLKFYSDDICGDNAIPRNVKSFVNNVIRKLQNIEEDTEIIGENFSLHFSKYAKRPTINELPREYRKAGPKTPSPRKGAGRPKKHCDDEDIIRSTPTLYDEYDYIPETVEEWVINIPTMLDARVALSVLDRETADTKFDEDYEFVYENGDDSERASDLGSDLNSSLKCPHCEEQFPAVWSLNIHCRTKHTEKSQFCETCKKNFATAMDLEQHAIIHKVSPKGRKSGSGLGVYKKVRPVTRTLKTKLGTIICQDCDGCEYDCDHSDHGVMLREGNIVEHFNSTGHKRCRNAKEIRAQTDCKVQMMSMAYSSVYGNKIRKLWKVLAKNDLLTSASYEFESSQKCKVKDCHFKASTAMEIFRHIREQHLTEIKHLNIKIGKPPSEETPKKSKRKPGPRSKTMKHLSPLPFFLYSGAENQSEENPLEQPDTQPEQLDIKPEPESESEIKPGEPETKPEDPEMDLESAISSISEMSSSHILEDAEKILEVEKEFESEKEEPMETDQEQEPLRNSSGSSSKGSTNHETDRDSNTPQSNNDSNTSEHELVLSKNETKVTLKASFEISDEMDIGDSAVEPKNSLLEIDPSNREQMEAIDVYLFDDSEDE
jgi:hypothetical protein